MRKIFYVRFYIIDSKRNRITMSATDFKKYLYSFDVDMVNMIALSDGDRAFLCEAPWTTFRKFKKNFSVFDIVKVRDIHGKKPSNRGGKHI